MSDFATPWTSSEYSGLISFRIDWYMIQFSSVQSLSHVRVFATPWTAACQASLSITNSRTLPKLMSIEPNPDKDVSKVLPYSEYNSRATCCHNVPPCHLINTGDLAPIFLCSKSCLCPWIHCSVSSVQSLSHVRFFVTPWSAACQASLSITNSRGLIKPMSIESVMPSSHLILCRPLLLLPPVPPSIRVFSNESTLHMRCPKYWCFIFSISPSNEHPSPLEWAGCISLQSKGLSRVFSSTIVQKLQFFSAQLSSQSNSHIHTWPLEKP